MNLRSTCKRYFAALLAALCLVSSLNVTAFATEPDYSKTTAEFVAERWAEGSDEAAVITSAGIEPGNKFTTNIPTEVDDLVTVELKDSTCKVTAQEHDGWHPVSVVVKNTAGEILGTATFAEGDTTAEVESITDPSFTAEVLYTKEVTVNEEQEARLLALPGKLAAAWNTMSTVVVAEDHFADLSDAFTYIHNAGLKNPALATAAEKAGVNKAADEVNNFLTLIETYKTADARTYYIWQDNNGTDFQAAIASTQSAVDNLYEKASESDNNAIENLISMIDPVVSDLEVMAAADWSFLSYEPGFTGANKALDDLAEKLAANGVADPGAADYAFYTTLSKERDVAKINLTVKATVASKTPVEFVPVTDAGTTALTDLTATIVLPAGTTKAEATQAVQTKVNELVQAWATYGVTDTEAFSCDVPDPLDDVLLEQGDKVYEYTVTYAPKTFNVQLGEVNKLYPYGTIISLTKHNSADKSYDYTVQTTGGKQSMAQGSTYVVTENVAITRSVDLNAIREYRVLDILAEDGQHTLNANEKAILSNAALASDTVFYRLPTTSGIKSITLSGERYIVQADTYSAGLDVVWVPVDVEVMNEKTVVDTLSMIEGAAFWEADEYEFTHINVVYKYEVKGSALDELNLPYELKQNINKQKELLISSDSNAWTAKKIYDNFNSDMMEMLSYDILNTSKVLLGADAKAAVDNILTNGWNQTTDEPAVYSYLKAAAAENWSLSKCIEKGYYEAIAQQIGLFAENLDVIVKDNNFTSMLDAAGYAEQKANVEKLCSELKELDETLKENPLHGAFVRDHGAFAKLVDTIDKAEDLREYKSEEAKNIQAAARVMMAKDKAYVLTVTVEAEQQGKTVSKTEQFIYAKDEKVLENKIGAEIAELEDALELTADVKEYYEAPVVSTTDGFTYGAELTGDATILKSYTLKTFTVNIVDENGEVVTSKVLKYGDKLFVHLPKEDDGETYYRYFIGEQELTDPNNQYWFENEDLLNFTNGVFTITRKAVDKKVEKFEGFVDAMNDGLAGLKDGSGNQMLTMIPLKDEDGAYAAVALKVLSSTDLNMGDMMKTMAAVFTTLSYDYIGMEVTLGTVGDFKAADANGDTKLNPQVLVDMMLNGGMGSKALLSTINADGTINPMVWNARGRNSQDLGGKLMESKLYLGNDKTSATELKFFVTLDDNNTSMLASFRKLLNRLDSFSEFKLEDGAVQIDSHVPENIYKLYLSMLVLLDRVDLNTMEDVQLMHEIAKIKEALQKLFDDDENPLNAQVLQNTLDKVGLSVNLMTYEAFINKMLNTFERAMDDKADGNLKFIEGANNKDDSYNFTVQYDMADRINSFGVDLSGLFAEGGTILEVPFYTTLENFGDFDYEAIVIDLKGEGIRGKFAYANDLNAALAEAKGPVYAILLKDIEGDLTVNKTTILNLNGKTITGNVTADASLRIVSSILNGQNAGGVTGTLSGKVNIANGTYGKDVSAFVQNGYEQGEDGVVRNLYYDIKDTENELTVTLDLEKTMQQVDQGNLMTLAMDLASDMALNLDVYAAVKVDDTPIYNIDVDVLDLLVNAQDKDYKAIADQLLRESVTRADLQKFVNNVIDDLTDVKHIKEVVKDGGTLAEYTMEVAPWEVTPAVKDSTLTINVGAGAPKTKTVSLEIKPLNDAQKETLAKLYRDVTDMISVSNRSFELGDISYVDGKLNWTGRATADVTFDLSAVAAEGEASDYVTALALILANNAEDKDEFHKDIKLYHNNEWSKGLEERFKTLTVLDLYNAVQKAQKGSEYFNDLIEDAGLTGDVEDVEALVSIYDAVLNAAARMTSGVKTLILRTENGEANWNKYTACKLSGLYDGETVKVMNATMQVFLKLFTDDYYSSVEDVIAKLEVLPTEFGDMDGEALLNLQRQVNDIEALLDGMSEAAKDMIDKELLDKLDKVKEYLADNIHLLVAEIREMLAGLRVLTEEEKKTKIEGYDELQAEVEDIRALIDGLTGEYLEEIKNDDNYAKLTDLEAYFARWNKILADVKELVELIDKLPEEIETTEEVLEIAVEAWEQYIALALDEDAKNYFETEYAEEFGKLKDFYDFFKDHLWVTEVKDWYYTGKAIKPEIKVYEGLEELKYKTDYTISYKNNTKAFDESDYAAAEAEVKAWKEANPNYKNDEKLQKKLDKLEISVLKKAPAVVINFKKNYSGSAYRYFNINRIDLSKVNDAAYCEMVGLDAQTEVYAAAAKKAKAVNPVITLNGKKVSTSEFEKAMLMKDGEVYTGEMTSGEYQVVVTAKEGKNFIGSYTATQYVDATLMSKVSIKLPAKSYTYTGEELKPVPVVTYKKKTLEEGEHYNVSYENNVDVGTATVTITAVPGSGFTGTKTATFKITGTKLTSKMLDMPKATKYYTGTDIELTSAALDATVEVAEGQYRLSDKGVFLEEGKDYTVSYTKNINKGTASVVFTGTGNYTGTIKKTFTIKAADISEIKWAGVEKATYSKGGVKLSEQVELLYNGIELVEGKDYTLSYKNNKKVFDHEGKTEAEMKKAPTVTIKGKGNFSGSLSDTFDITKADLADMLGVAKDVQFKEKKGNYKTTITLTDVDGKKLSTSDYDKNFTYEYATYDENGGVTWTPVDTTDKQFSVPMDETKGYVNMRIQVKASPKSTNYTTEEGPLIIEYRLYSTAITKAKVTSDKVKLVYNRSKQDYVAIADLKLFDKTANEYLVLDEDFQVEYVKNHWFLAGSVTMEISGLNEYGGTKKLTFKVNKNTDDVEALDDRINFFKNAEDTQQILMLMNEQPSMFAVYDAAPIFVF